MKTLGEVLNLSIEFLKAKRYIRSRRAVEEIIAFVLNLKRLDLYMQFDRPMEDVELEQIRGLLKRAAKLEPVEYLVGKHPFYGCLFSLNSHVLIPRPETEILLDKVCSEVSGEVSGRVVLDLCTGSGCLGVAFKKRFPEATVFLSDRSPEALEVARQNALDNGVQVEILEGDLLEPFFGKKVDIFLCNPPYVSSSEYESLDPSVKDFEPKEALVGGVDGLDYYRRLHVALPGVLSKGAKLFFEIGSGQAEALQRLFVEPCWKNIRVDQDFAGHDRFFFLEFE